VRAQTRHQLKQDRFAATAAETYSWAVAHRSKLVIGGIVAAVVLAIVVGTWWYTQYREHDASLDLAKALRTYEAPLRPPGQPAQSEMLSFASAPERARVANGEFRRVADKYSHTPSGKVARYFVALTYIDMADNAAAERELKHVADSAKPELAGMAKLALASLYRSTNRDQQAIDLYKQLADHPTATVSKSTAQLELAAAYEAKQPAEARRIYEQIRKDEPQGPAAQTAATRLADLK
jgi:predicted negative regulator of RcsB-dependent stress response